MDTERKIAEAFIADADQIELSPRLWSRIRREVETTAMLSKGKYNPGLRPAWMIALAVLVVMIAGTLVIGPQRAYAEFLKLFGYISGAGIVEVEQGKALTTPVAYSQKGISIRVENLIAASDHTLLVWTISGLPEGETPSYASLQLPDGTRLFSNEHQIAAGDSSATDFYFRITEIFTPLTDVSDVQLIWERQPLDQSGTTDPWTIPLQLEPLTDELRARLYPPAYQPVQASSVQHGVVLQVVQVAAADASTAIQLQLQSPETFSQLIVRDSTLSDDTGHVYEQQVQGEEFSDQGQQIVRSTNPGTQPTWSINQTLTYSPTGPFANSLTLSIDQLVFRSLFDRNGHPLQVPMKSGAQVGDSWAIDLSLPFADQTIHLSQAKLVEGDDQGTKFPVLVLIPDQLSEVEGAKIGSIQARGDARGYANLENPEPLIAVKLGEEDLQADMITIVIEYVEGFLQGPWRITWLVP